jgi:ElaB/YqjD/DUF883 family membrane-anchored ribosome-binding protein
MSDNPHTNGHDEDPENHFEATKAHARAAASEMRGVATEVAREIKERAGALAGKWKDKARQVHKEIEHYVREHPTKSVLAAVGVGFVLGLVFRR